jgi:pimeloyl-ACP methyl ester carboxylesterase
MKPLTILLFVALSCCTNVRDTENVQDEQAIHPEVISDGTSIDYQVCGSGDITLVFVHGWCINQSYWSYQSDGFCSNYKIVTLDLPGFGNSGKDRDNWSIEQYGRDVNQVIDQLQLDQVVLVGHSMGGDIILEAALGNDKVIALVGVDNFKEVGMEFDSQLQEEIAGFLDILESNFSQVAAAYAEGALLHPETDTILKQRVVDDILTSDSIIAVASLESLFEYTPKEVQRLSKLKQKLFLINSSITPTDTAALRQTGVRFQVLEIAGTGHYPMIEKPGEFNKRLKTVLDQVRSNI